MTSLVVRNLSFYDICQGGYEIQTEIISYKKADGKPATREIFKLAKDGNPLPRKEFYNILFHMGLDPYTYRRVQILGPARHRSLTGDIVYERWYSCPERLDAEWIRGGFASEEAKIESSGMKDMSNVVRSLQRGNRNEY